MRTRRQPQTGRAPTRREFAIAALAGISALAGDTARATAAAKPLSQEDALKALDPWINAVFTGDPVIAEKVLAPEFQILRSDGSGQDNASYLKVLPKQRFRPKLSNIVATAGADIMVVRYRIETHQTVQGKENKGIAPRLSVFRREAGQWLISAHANFAAMV
jgi:hypothetical protein